MFLKKDGNDRFVNIYVSTGAFDHQKFNAILELCLKYDIKNVELSSAVGYEPNLLKAVFESHEKGINFLVHNYFPPAEEAFVLNLASTNDETLYRSRQHCKEAIDLCVEINSPFYSVHSGLAIELEPQLLGRPKAQAKLCNASSVPYEKAYGNFVESLLEINRYAKSKGIGFLIENNLMTPLQRTTGQDEVFLMVSAEEVERVMQDINDPNFGVLVDIGHLNVSAEARGFDREDFIRQLSPYIRAFHLSENDGRTDQNLSIHDDSWFLPILKDFPESAFVIEAYDLSITQIKEQIQIVKGVD
jgi:sugar phosphate isomerase/epimerase